MNMAKETKRTTARKTKAADTTTRGKVVKSASKPIPTEEQIRLRAYQIYLARNGGPGDAMSDWIQAERELMEEMSR